MFCQYSYKVLLDIAKAEVCELDRWSLKVTRLPYSGKEEAERSELPPIFHCKIRAG